MLRQQAAITVEAMDALAAWSGGDATAAVTVRDCEHRADETKRQLWRALRDAFSPPLDAEDPYTLSADLDEVLNAAKDLTRGMDLMDMAPGPPTHDIVPCWPNRSTSPVRSNASAATVTRPNWPTPPSRSSDG
jgi:uncharacterized protein Yka (UPF0111/DUF47 family)